MRRELGKEVQHAYLADVFVLSEFRGRGLGVALVREAVENGSHRGPALDLGTDDAHELYRRFAFGDPSPQVMERLPPS